MAAVIVAGDRPAPGLIVDVGSGPGDFLAVMLQQFPSARGIWTDASEAMLGLARDRLADGAGAPGRGRGSPVMSERVTVPSLQQMKHEGRKIVGVVAWDYQMARIADRAGVEIVSVGDSVGVNLWGQRNPLEVTVKQMLIAAQAARRGVTRARPGRLARHLRRPVPRRVPAPGRVLGRPGQRADRADGPGPDPSVPRLGPLSLRLFPPAPVAAARARCGRPGPAGRRRWRLSGRPCPRRPCCGCRRRTAPRR